MGRVCRVRNGCNPVPAVAGHTVHLLSAPTTSVGDVNSGDLGASDSDGDDPPILQSSSDEGEPVAEKRKSRQYKRHKKWGGCTGAESSSDDDSVCAWHPIPSMPTVRERNSRHRDKCFKERLFPWNAAVARPVGKAEIARTP